MRVPSELFHACRSAAVRFTLRRATRRGAQASAFALVGALVASLATLVVPVVVPVVWVLAAALALGGLTTLLAAGFRPVGIRTASQLLDQQLDLHERTSTALELAFAPSVPSPLGARVIADAIRHLQGVELRQAVPLRPPREAWGAALLAILVVFSNVWLRGVTIPGTPAGRATQLIREEGSRLAKVAQALQDRAKAERTPQTRRLTAQMQDLGARLQHDRVDRAEALARIAELSRQAERVRREVSGRLDSALPSPRPQASVPSNLLRREALDRQIKQLRELNSRLNEDATAADRQKTLGRLAAMTDQAQEGSAQVQRQLEQARTQLQRGNVGQAGSAISEALRNLEGMQSLLADEEGLRTAQQQLERSGTNIASGGSQPAAPESAEMAPPSGRLPVTSGSTPPASDASGETSIPPQGPNEGITAGSGQVTDKLGAPSSRLQGPKSSERLRGAQGQGEVSVSEVLGAARPGVSHLPVAAVPPTVVPQADHYMERASIPARYRLLVRRYFERLVQLR